MPCCCTRCGAAFDARTQQQLKMLARLAELGMQLSETVAEFPIRSRQLDANDSYHYELLSRGVRRSLALECKLTEDARKRHAREAHGAPPRERPEDKRGDGEDADSERPAKPLPLVTAEDVEPVTGPEPTGRETAETLLSDAREDLRDRFVENHTAAVVAASICLDLGIEEDVSIFREPVPTRDDPWVRAEADAVAEPPQTPGVGPAAPEAAAQPSDELPPKGRDPP
jgi:hypothetical protein